MNAIPLWSHYLEDYIFVGRGMGRYASAFDQLITITPPTSLAVPLADVKKYLHIDDTENDVIITRLIKAATFYAQNNTGAWFAPTELEYRLAEWPWGLDYPNRIALPAFPVRSLTSVKYLDKDGAEQTVDPSNYELVAGASISLVMFERGFTYPGIKRGTYPVRFRFKAGYNTPVPATGDDPKLNIPEEAIVAIMMVVVNWYENRGDIASNNLKDALTAADNILAQLRIYRG